jgi:methionyl-tRNA formyltransferase
VSRTVFLGTSDFAATVLGRLGESAHRPALVVTPPDSRRGRGRREQQPPAAVRARELGLPLLQARSVNSEEALERIREAKPEVAVVCAFGQLIRDPLLSEVSLLNVHPSLLPRWRGAAPIERAIDAGDRETGVTIMRPEPELDAGPICLQRAEPIRPDDDFGALAARLEALSAELLGAALDSPPECRPQPQEGATYASKVTAEDRRLDPARPAEALERRVRALRPHIGAWVALPDGGRLGVRRARVVGADPAPVPGELAESAGRLVLGCAGGALELEEVQPPGGRPMPGTAYLRGNAARLASGP